jgi:hypothetical protein
MQPNIIIDRDAVLLSRAAPLVAEARELGGHAADRGYEQISSSVPHTI